MGLGGDSKNTVLHWLSGFKRFGIRPGLERMQYLLDIMGEPHKRLRFIHVAGTNGKGSTCSYLASTYMEAGYKVGLYTSPYIQSFHDRMSVQGEEITDGELDEIARELKPFVDRMVMSAGLGEPTEFEIVTMIALLYFARKEPDIVVWETGLGGRLDATNVVMPLLTVITNVGYDHMHILGSTLEEIAREKAGIIKPGVPVLTAARDPGLHVIKKEAVRLRAPLSVLGDDFGYKRISYSWDRQIFEFWNSTGEGRRYRIALLGEHQCSNASLAVAAMHTLSCRGELPIAEHSIQNGIHNARWPGRMELVSTDPFIVLDGAHNADGVRALVNTLYELSGSRRKTVVVGILADKVNEAVLEPIVQLADRIIITQPDNPRKAEADVVAGLVRRLRDNIPVTVCPAVRDAVQDAIDGRSTIDEMIVCTGSLYTISEARNYIKKQEFSCR